MKTTFVFINGKRYLKIKPKWVKGYRPAARFILQ